MQLQSRRKITNPHKFMWLTTQAQIVAHSSSLGTIAKYLNELQLEDKGLKKVNYLIKLVENSVI
ncbi:MAG: hypothetical protein RR942_04955 [Romboutsia sp.]